MVDIEYQDVGTSYMSSSGSDQSSEETKKGSKRKASCESGHSSHESEPFSKKTKASVKNYETEPVSTSYIIAEQAKLIEYYKSTLEKETTRLRQDIDNYVSITKSLQEVNARLMKEIDELKAMHPNGTCQLGVLSKSAMECSDSKAEEYEKDSTINLTRFKAMKAKMDENEGDGKPIPSGFLEKFLKTVSI
jgi:hypothetical protein